MISLLEGELIQKDGLKVVVSTLGVGYEVHVPLPTAERLGDLGEQVRLYTHLLLREEGLHLYGFSTEEERRLFLELIGISGVGPRLALAVLSHLRPEDLVRTIRRQDRAVLQTIPGVGRKTADRILIDLKDRYPAMEEEEEVAAAAVGVDGPSAREAVAALVALGYRSTEAAKAVQEAVAAVGEGATPEVLIRHALRPAR